MTFLLKIARRRLWPWLGLVSLLLPLEGMACDVACAHMHSASLRGIAAADPGVTRATASRRCNAPAEPSFALSRSPVEAAALPARSGSHRPADGQAAGIGFPAEEGVRRAGALLASGDIHGPPPIPGARTYLVTLRLRI